MFLVREEVLWGPFASPLFLSQYYLRSVGRAFLMIGRHKPIDSGNLATPGQTRNASIPVTSQHFDSACFIPILVTPLLRPNRPCTAITVTGHFP
jgi:hypothetical protein